MMRRSTALLLPLLLVFLLALTVSRLPLLASAVSTHSRSSISASSSNTWKPRSFPNLFRGANSNPNGHRRFFLPNPCKLEDERTGASFDLTGLRRAGSDYTATDGEYFYRMNVCGPVVNGGTQCGNGLVCQYSGSNTNNFVAKIAVYDGYFGPRLTLIDGNNPGLGVQAHYLNGDVCYIGPMKKRNPRTTIIQYRCSSHTPDTFSIHEDKDTCTFTITFETEKACWPPGSANGGISRGTVFVVLFILIAGVYLVGGYMYLQGQGNTGIDAIPHYTFWTETLPALVKDGCIYSWAKFSEFKEKRLKNGAGGLLGGGGEVDPDDPYGGRGAPTARTDDL